MILFGVLAAAAVLTSKGDHKAPHQTATLVVTTLNCLFDTSATPQLSVLKMNNRAMGHFFLDGPTALARATSAPPVRLAPALTRFRLQLPPGNYEIYAASKWCSGQVMAVLAAGHARSTSIALQQYGSMNMLFDHDHASVVGDVPVPGMSVVARRYDDPSDSQPAIIANGEFYFDSLQRIRWILEFRSGCCDIARFGLDLGSVSAGDYAVLNLKVDNIAARRDYNGPIFSDPAAIASSPTQPIWFTNSGRNTIGYLSSDNVPHELATRLIAQPDEMVAGPDGTIWFSETGTPAVGYVDTAKQIHEIDLHDEHGSTESWGPRSLVATNAAAWMVDPAGQSVVRASTSGSFQRFDTSSASSWVRNLGVDGSGSIWFPTGDHNSIARVTPDGLHVYGTTQSIVLLDHTQHVGHYIYFLASDKLIVAEIAGSSSGSTVVATAGNHGSLSPDDADGAWYADCSNKSLAHFLDGKDVGHLQLASDQCPRRVVGDGNGGVWFWTANPVRLDHIAGSGAVKVFEVPQNFQPASTVRSADGTVWFVEYGANKIGYVANGKQGSIDLGNPGATPNLTVVP